MGIRDEDFEAARPDLRRAVDGLGELVESYYHQLPGLAQAHERIFAQFADRSQVDLVLFPASVPGGSVPDAVVLYDPDDRLVTAAERKPVTSGQIREWAFGGWCALADLGKYLRRGSTWEALARLNEARAQLWRLGRYPGHAGSAVRPHQHPGLRARAGSGEFRGHRSGS